MHFSTTNRMTKSQHMVVIDMFSSSVICYRIIVHDQGATELFAIIFIVQFAPPNIAWEPLSLAYPHIVTLTTILPHLFKEFIKLKQCHHFVGLQRSNVYNILFVLSPWAYNAHDPSHPPSSFWCLTNYWIVICMHGCIARATIVF
jgi:hypothetical protein